jgi:hypothetical protein
MRGRLAVLLLAVVRVPFLINLDQFRPTLQPVPGARQRGYARQPAAQNSARTGHGGRSLRGRGSGLRQTRFHKGAVPARRRRDLAIHHVAQADRHESVSYSDHYPEQGIFQRLMDRLRAITVGEKGFVPVLALALRC